MPCYGRFDNRMRPCRRRKSSRLKSESRHGDTATDLNGHGGKRVKRRFSIRQAVFGTAVVSLALGLTTPAAAQFSDSYKFLEAVKKADGAAVASAVEQPGVTLINTRDRNSGVTALHITVDRKDLTWTNYLLSHGARPDIADNGGRTPLMLAVEKNFPEGVETLLQYKADPNQTNNSGETALIRAVQMHDVGMVRILVANGADPRQQDALAGMSLWITPIATRVSLVLSKR